MTIAYSRPRQIAVCNVRRGDQVAVFAGTGLFAGPLAAESGDPDRIVWLDVDRFTVGFGRPATSGVVLTSGEVKPAGWLEHVVIREPVSIDE